MLVSVSPLRVHTDKFLLASPFECQMHWQIKDEREVAPAFEGTQAAKSGVRHLAGYVRSTRAA